MVFATLSAMAWRNLWRHSRRSLITASAMAVAAALCMALIALNDGVYADLNRVMVDQKLGHVVVQHPDYPVRRQMYDTVPDLESVLKQIEVTPMVMEVNPRMEGYGLVGAGDKAVGGQLVGVLPLREARATRLDEQLVEGSLLGAEAEGGAMLGIGLAEQLEVGVGDEVIVVTQAADGSTGNALYHVAGTLRTADTAFDRAGVMLHLDDMQELLVLPDQAHQITVRTSDPEETDALAGALEQSLPDALQVQPWWLASPSTAQMMQMQQAGSAMVLLIVFTVAAFGVINTMTMSVFERTRELGVLRALGMRRGRLVTLVVLESFFLGTIAAVIGGVLGGFLDFYLVYYGIDFTGGEGSLSFSGVNLDPIIRGKVELEGVFMVLGSVIGVSVLASLWPAYRAALLHPVDAIRSE